MAAQHLDRLTMADAAFLWQEDRGTHAHIGWVMIADGPPPAYADLLKHVKARPLGWGGIRAGAGRQSTGRQPVLLRLTPKTVRKLRAAARKQGTTLSELAEQRLAAV